MRKKFLTFWLPPLLWAAFMFPLGNQVLSNSLTYRVVVSVFRWFFPHAGEDVVGLFYIVVRKSFHFVEYGLLAFLLYRAFRGGRRPRWSQKWAIPAGAISVAYGFLDEFVQAFVPSRNASLFDVAVDTAGVVVALALIALNANKTENQTSILRHVPPFWKCLFLKRPFDIILSFIGMVLSSPLWLLFSFLVRLQDRGPVFYRQDRVGRHGRIFKALKFRSMIKDAEKGRGPVQAVENDPRVTPVGRILRATAMDELPQLWNIFKGDMSFVGPRALRPEEREVHGNPDERRMDDIPGYRQRNQVRPGLTGLAQVYLPSDAPRRKKFRYDLLYIRKRSFRFDLKIIVLSFWITFRGKWESRQKKI